MGHAFARRFEERSFSVSFRNNRTRSAFHLRPGISSDFPASSKNKDAYL